MILIKPWIGKFYGQGLDGKKILIVGDSHYGEETDLSEEMTIEVIRRFCNVEPKTWQQESITFYTKIATLLLQKESAYEVSWEQLGDFYNRIAFCNFLQGLAGDSPYGYATEDMYRSSVEPFKNIVSDLEPDIIVVNKTVELEKYLPETNAKTIWIGHMTRASYEPWRSSIREIWDD